MVTLNVTAHMHPKLAGMLTDLGPVWRRAILGVGATGLQIEVASHIRREASGRHRTASRLGARPTGHLEKGAARITSHATADRATVRVPIAGIARAFRDLEIVPVKAKALTIPVSAAAYGHRVRELARMGWSIFRPKGHDVLMGSRTGSEAEALYALKKRVVVRQDRTLLPSDEAISAAINKACAAYVKFELSRRTA